jgi:hypothetical protein
MKDLLKEAIADAKAVRQTALANAKMALEEAFTPRLQSMLSAKLAEEMSEEDEEMPAEEEMPTEGEEMEDEGMPAEEPVEEGDEDEEYSDDRGLESEPADDDQISDKEEDDLDLEEIIRELEGDEEPAMEEPAMEDSMEEGEEMSDDEMDEEINIEEIIKSLREEDEEQELPEEEETEEVPEAELEEAYNVIRFLKGKINEVNLLNAKLLYSNKLFRNFSLNEGQKMKVIENFDRAFTLREVKLVYSTLAEGFKMPSTRKVVKESFASKPIASTKPARQIISEGTELANRFKKLAGLK